MDYDKVSLVRKHFHSCSNSYTNAIFVVTKTFFVTFNSSRPVDTCPDPKNFYMGVIILGVNMFAYLFN